MNNSDYDMEMYDHLWSQQWQNVQDIGPLNHNRYRLMVRELPKSSMEDCSILDLGCGRGAFLSILKNKYPKATLSGIEYSEEGKKSAHPEIRNIIQVGDLYEVAEGLPRNFYDLVICSEVIEHLPEPEPAVDIVFSLLKPGGIALLTVPCNMRYWSKQDEAAGHYRRFGMNEFAYLVTNSGLSVKNNYGWGTFLGLIYYQMVSALGAEKVMKTKVTFMSKIISRFLQFVFRVDDFLVSSQGIQLITVAQKP
jgi:SAM-dependent methyltransferase